MVSQAEELGEVGAELAFYATKGAMNALDEAFADVGELAKGAVLGVLSVLGKTAWDNGNIHEVVQAASHGTVQGANESGADLAEAATQAVAGAKEAAPEVGLSEEEARDRTVQGAIAAASAISPQAVVLVTEALRGRTKG